ncbi:transcription elongation factor GreB [Methylotenera sp.]|jgi:transcription elongation factor GreB|uniref:transcription elongation factor GreB n=1 Tax=Methylotenera sp. TaxID=2051956 RepID=UPI00271778A3|nr:transcription elongation factor GreB [Methylotenera sp.]MDO9204085.1 transcription elongation factor GreB [Methylotenera sp.]MDP1521867.1 transcription elongation factor GreB [Methylotenera sp.]MDP2072095.1 transcription elongation factor GreB [Methylotenera sp.]MDP3006895.1 transcription elongation factor GreB [Methylotenera sp.]MDP3007168.1 transcription elongation factor GreB [Methylotenera sp.]
MADEKNYITPQGHAAIEAEFQQLLKVERPELVKVVSWAAGNGDRSENGDYIYGKRRLRQIDSRLRFLMQRMDLAVIVDPAKQQGLNKIFFGAWVTLFSLKDDTEHTYRIVGKDELEPSLGYISWVSPLARAMLGKQIGDVVKVPTPAGEDEYEVIAIQYTPPS